METVELDCAEIKVAELVLRSGLVPTKAEARRLIRQKAVTLDGEILGDELAVVAIKPGAVLKVGKRRFIRLDIK